MILLLSVIAAIIFIVSLMAGFLSGSLLGILIAVTSGTTSAVIIFALAKILDNQERILSKLVRQEVFSRKTFPLQKVICPKCNYKYDNDYTSCPHCGYRE